MNRIVKIIDARQDAKCTSAKTVQVFDAGLDDLIVLTLEIAFTLTDCQDWKLSIPHRAIRGGWRLVVPTIDSHARTPKDEHEQSEQDHLRFF